MSFTSYEININLKSIYLLKNGILKSIYHLSGKSKILNDPWRRVKFVICPFKALLSHIIAKMWIKINHIYLFLFRFKVVCWSININDIWSGLSWIHCYLHTLTQTGYSYYICLNHQKTSYWLSMYMFVKELNNR